MKIDTIAKAVQALFKMAYEFRAYYPASAPEGDAHPEQYGALFMRPLTSELFQCAVRANRCRLIRVTFDGEIAAGLGKIFTEAQHIKEFHALDISELQLEALDPELFYLDPRSWAECSLSTEFYHKVAANLWPAVDELFSEELEHHTIEPVDVDLVQVAECIKGVSHFIAPTPAQAFVKGSRMGRYGYIENTDRFVKVAGGCEHVLAEAICAPLRPVTAIKL